MSLINGPRVSWVAVLLRSFVVGALILAQSSVTLATVKLAGDVAIELEFSNAAIRKARKNPNNITDTHSNLAAYYQRQFRDEVLRRCARCEVQELNDKYGISKYRITLPSGWFFEITLDPGLIEITANSLEWKELLENRGEMENLIWGSAAQIGLRFDTAGHLNFGIEKTFGGDSRLFANFLADYFNHVELTEGLMGYLDVRNAPHPERLRNRQANALKNILNTFDPEKSSIQDLARLIVREVYYRSTAYGIGDGEPAEKYHAVNLVSIAEGKPWPRVELRAVGMQKSVHELELLVKLYLARIAYLKRQEAPLKIPYVADASFHSLSTDSMVESFHRYVTESGLNWQDYRSLISKEMRFQKALRRFETRAFHAPQAPPLCAQIFR